MTPWWPESYDPPVLPWLLALLPVQGAPFQGPMPASPSDLELASGWISMCDERARPEWGALPADWSFAEGVIRRAPEAHDYLGWRKVLTAFELDFQWREPPAEAWQRGRIVLREDNSALALLGAERIERAQDSNLPSFRAGPFELTPAQAQPGWHISLRPGDARPGGAVELRGLRLRDRKAPLGKPVEIFDGNTLKGWRALGDAKWNVENGAIVGEVGGGSQSFLCSERELGDFVFEVEVKNDLPGNSGIQIRSHENSEHRLFGYQIEIDPSARSWSGGLYDEARRGWLDDLSDDALARAAFKSGEWNRYRIECIGPWIRAWVNDVPTADYLDVKDLSGFIGLQVHSGKDTRMQWRGFKLRELGKSGWTPLEIPGPLVGDLRHESVAAGFSILMSHGGGDLSLELLSIERMLDPDLPLQPDPDPDLSANPEVMWTDDYFDGLLRLAGPDWTATMRTSGIAPGEHQLLVLCHPPRLAIELDGRRIERVAWEAALRQRSMCAEAWISQYFTDRIQHAETLQRD